VRWEVVISEPARRMRIEGCHRGNPRKRQQDQAYSGLMIPKRVHNPDTSRSKPRSSCRRSGLGRATGRVSRPVSRPRPPLPMWSCPSSSSGTGHGRIEPTYSPCGSSDTGVLPLRCSFLSLIRLVARRRSAESGLPLCFVGAICPNGRRHSRIGVSVLQRENV
jgi:hypothetical protein